MTTPGQPTPQQVAADYIARRFPNSDESDDSRPRQSRARLIADAVIAKRFPASDER